MENVPAKRCIYVVDAVEEDPTMSRRNGVPHVAMVKRRPLDDIHGKLKTSTESESVKTRFHGLKAVEIPFIDSHKN